MPDTSQTNPTSDDNSTADSVPKLGNLEYSTPSAYIDPTFALSASPAPKEPKPEEPAPEEPKPEEPKPEEPKPEEPAQEEPAPEAPEEPTPEEFKPKEPARKTPAGSINEQIAERIMDARNILIALPNSPSADELASAIGLSLFLSRLDKRAVAIYTGQIPESLEFLNPKQTFETNPDVLQDFVIALDKNKADHIRYKLDGAFVKIYVTPFKSRITAKDLDYSYGDYNIDLTIALNVSSEDNLDAALKDHTRAIQESGVINISNSGSTNFGELKWLDPSVSSVAEMVSNLILNMGSGTKLNAREATALLTGIVAATNHFAINTKSSTMQVASELIEIGANPEQVAAGVANAANVEFNEPEDFPSSFSDEKTTPAEEESREPIEETPQETPPETPEETPEEAPTEEPQEPASPSDDSPAETASLLDELKATEASLSGSTMAGPAILAQSTTPVASAIPTTELSIPAPAMDTTNKYSQMLDEALSEPSTNAPAPMESSLPPATPPNPAVSSAPTIAPAPDVPNIPDINFGQTTSEEVLPPPPAPPVDINSPMPLPAQGDLPPVPQIPTEPTPPVPQIPTEPTPPVPNIPAPTSSSSPTPPDPSAFTIPGV